MGAPLVPLWGVWADKYSRKAVIVRSALVEAVVFALAALAALLAEQRVELVELQVKKASLEDVFVGLTKRDDGVASPAAEQASVAPKASAGSKGSPR